MPFFRRKEAKKHHASPSILSASRPSDTVVSSMAERLGDLRTEPVNTPSEAVAASGATPVSTTGEARAYADALTPAPPAPATSASAEQVLVAEPPVLDASSNAATGSALAPDPAPTPPDVGNPTTQGETASDSALPPEGVLPDPLATSGSLEPAPSSASADRVRIWRETSARPSAPKSDGPRKKKAKTMANNKPKGRNKRTSSSKNAAQRAVRRPSAKNHVTHRNGSTPESATPEPSAAPQTAFPSNIENPRQAFVCLSWFEYLLKRVPANELPYLIDQYRNIGWIDGPLHAWFLKMAEGVGGTRTKAGEKQFARQGARSLVAIHKETLRFLKQLRSVAAPAVAAPAAVAVSVIPRAKK